MPSLCITFTAYAADRIPLPGSAAIHMSEPLLSYRVEVDERPTDATLRPCVPVASGPVLATLADVAEAVFVAIGPDPDPTREPRWLIAAGGWRRLPVTPGHRVAAVLAGSAQTAGPDPSASPDPEALRRASRPAEAR